MIACSVLYEVLRTLTGELKLMTVLVLKGMKRHAVAEHAMCDYRLQRNGSAFEQLCVVAGKQEKVVISSEKLHVVTCK